MWLLTLLAFLRHEYLETEKKNQRGEGEISSRPPFFFVFFCKRFLEVAFALQLKNTGYSDYENNTKERTYALIAFSHINLR